MNNTKSLPLVWEYDGNGKWEAPSQVMDPEMTDEPQEKWCKEWCLKWRIRVMEDGRFSCSESDKSLLYHISNGLRHSLRILQAHIDLAEYDIRGAAFVDDQLKQPVTLLPADKYAK